MSEQGSLGQGLARALSGVDGRPHCSGQTKLRTSRGWSQAPDGGGCGPLSCDFVASIGSTDHLPIIRGREVHLQASPSRFKSTRDRQQDFDISQPLITFFFLRSFRCTFILFTRFLIPTSKDGMPIFPVPAIPSPSSKQASRADRAREHRPEHVALSHALFPNDPSIYTHRHTVPSFHNTNNLSHPTSKQASERTLANHSCFPPSLSRAQASPRAGSPSGPTASSTGVIGGPRPSSPPPPGGPRTAIRRRAAADQKERLANARPNSTRAAGAGGSSSTMLRLYTDESPGLKVDPVVVLVLSLVFIFSVVGLHSESSLSPPFLLLSFSFLLSSFLFLFLFRPLLDLWKEKTAWC